MKTLIVTSVLMIAAIGGLWVYAQAHADSSAYVFDEQALHERPRSETALPDDEVLIRVNGRPITQTEFEVALASFPENTRAVMFTPAGRKVIAEELIRLELLAEKAESEGLEDNEMVRRQIRRSQYETELVRKNILAQAALRKMLEKPEVEGSLRDLYDRIKSEFETATTRQIIVGWSGSRVGKEGVTRTQSEALTRAREAAEKLRAGAEFDAVFSEYADNPGNGDLGPVRKDSMPPDLAEPIFALAEGETSEPVETPWGYHVFQVTERQTPAFEEIEQQLESQSQQLWARVAVDALREIATVEMDEEFFGTMNAER